MKLLLTIFSIVLVVVIGYGQDTIKIEPSLYYSSAVHRDSRSFAGYVGYAREDIVYSDSLRSIQYCYYLDSVKHCIGSLYQLKSNDVVQVSNYKDTIQWKYTELMDSLYEVSAYIDGLYYTGFASSLQPLIFCEKLVTTTADKIDTLWSALYDYSSHSPEGYPIYTLHKNVIKGKVYSSKQCEVLPRRLDGTAFTEFTWDNTEGCYNDPYYIVTRVVFVVTAEGRIVNISEMGNLDWSCSPVYIDFLKEVFSHSPLLPATRKGKPVNIKWEVQVNMKYY